MAAHKKKLKVEIRERMVRTGETYSTARMHVLFGAQSPPPPPPPTAKSNPGGGDGRSYSILPPTVDELLQQLSDGDLELEAVAREFDALGECDVCGEERLIDEYDLAGQIAEHYQVTEGEERITETLLDIVPGSDLDSVYLVEGNLCLHCNNVMDSEHA